MDILKLFRKRMVILPMMIVGITGGIFLMPVPLNGEYTCFYHLHFNYNQPVRIYNPDYSYATSEDIHKHDKSIGVGMDHHGQELLNMYIHHYAFFWWGSLGLIAFCAYRLRNLNIHTKKKYS